MKYICDVENRVIEDDDHVKIVIQPETGNGGWSYRDNAEEVRATFMVSHNVAKAMIEWIKTGVLQEALMVFEPKTKVLLPDGHPIKEIGELEFPTLEYKEKETTNA